MMSATPEKQDERAQVKSESPPEKNTKILDIKGTFLDVDFTSVIKRVGDSGSDLLQGFKQLLPTGQPQPAPPPADGKYLVQVPWTPQRVSLPKKLLRVPLARQSTNWTCGVAALQALLRYFGLDLDIREDNLCKELKAGPDHGTRYVEIMRVAKERGLVVEERRGKTIDELKQDVDKGTPVLVCYQAWVEPEGDETRDWSERWDDGHYSVVVGYDDERLFFMDPSTLGSYAYIPYGEFEARWHDIDGVEPETIKLVHWGLSFSRPKAMENESLHTTASYLG